MIDTDLPSTAEAEPETIKADTTEEKKSKPLKNMDDDSLVAVESEEDEGEIKTQGDTVTSLRLQRCRNRIWLDLRDGIDLKALARMDSQAAREEVYSAVEEISRFP